MKVYDIYKDTMAQVQNQSDEWKSLMQKAASELIAHLDNLGLEGEFKENLNRKILHFNIAVNNFNVTELKKAYLDAELNRVLTGSESFVLKPSFNQNHTNIKKYTGGGQTADEKQS